MKKNSGKKSFRKHILYSILSLITCIFIVIYISFNLLVVRYIKKKAYNDLNTAVESVQHISSKAVSSVYEKRGREYEKRLHGGGNGRSSVNVITLNSDYEIVDGDAEYINIYNLDYISEYLKDNNIDLSSEEMMKIEIDRESYYVTFRKCNNNVDEERYLVFVEDVTNEEHLGKTMNAMLFVIMTVGGIVTIILSSLLSRRIVKPINLLCRFADRIGRGQFERYDAEFSDKETNQLLNVMNEAVTALDKYDKEQKIFFQNVSHELRTPLMSIKGYAEGIKYDVLDKNTASDVILQEGNRLEGLIEELLYMSRMDNITKDYVLVERDLREILSDCIVRQNAIAINRGINFSCNFSEEPCLLKCDEKSMFKAFSNIINNSLRYAEEKIIVNCKKENGDIIISIENDGEHIKEEEKDKVFERFYKGEKGRHGIGLSIVKSVITKHDGEIYVDNTEDGVKFTIIF